jgi:photosystem II stability/assembly factor-like uncharacterized protein
MVHRVFVIVVLFAASYAYGESWTVIPSGTANHLRSISASSNKIWFACGEHGAVVTTTDGGLHWSQMRSTGINALYAISSNDTSFVFAVGERGSMIYAFGTQGGWRLPTPMSDTLFAVSDSVFRWDTTIGGPDYWQHTIAKVTYWSVGVKGEVQKLEFFKDRWHYPGYPQFDYDSIYSGQSTIGSGLTTTLRGIYIRKSIIIVGVDGVVLRSVNDGRSWTQQSLGTGTNLLCIAAQGANNLVIVGSGGAMWRSVNDGISWTNISIPGMTENLTSAYFINADLGAVVGDNGMVLLTTNGGGTWVRQSVNTFANLYGVRGYSAMGLTTWMAAGDSGTVIGTFLGGGTVTYTVNHDQIDLGEVATGMMKRDTLQITNPTLEGYVAMRLSCPDPRVSVTPSQFLVNPLSTKSVIISYTPADTGLFRVPLVIKHDTSWFPDTMYITGRGTTVFSHVSVQELDFGPARTATDTLLRIWGTGNVPFRIVSVKLTDTATFSTTLAAPLQLDPGQIHEFNVHVKHAVSTDIVRYLIIQTNSRTGADSVRIMVQTPGGEGVRDNVQANLLRSAGYPNPVVQGRTLSLALGEASRAVVITLFDERGAMVFKQVTTTDVAGNVPIATASLRSGTYFIHVDSGDKRVANATFTVR